MVPTSASNRLSSCSVSDAMAAADVPGGVITGIPPMGAAPAVAGPAFPVRFEPGTHGGFNDYLDQVPTGHIVVIDAGGRTDLSVWGGLVALEALRLGLAGTVVHGACRDAEEFAASGYPVFARSTTPRSGRLRLVSVEPGQPVVVDGVQIGLGDLVVADRDGVVVVPQDAAGAVVERAQAIESRDRLIASDVRSGTSLAEARGRHG